MQTKLIRLCVQIYLGKITSLKQTMNMHEYMQKVVHILHILHTHLPQKIANVQQNRDMTYFDLLPFLKNLQRRQYQTRETTSTFTLKTRHCIILPKNYIQFGHYLKNFQACLVYVVKATYSATSVNLPTPHSPSSEFCTILATSYDQVMSHNVFTNTALHSD